MEVEPVLAQEEQQSLPLYSQPGLPPCREIRNEEPPLVIAPTSRLLPRPSLRIGLLDSRLGHRCKISAWRASSLDMTRPRVEEKNDGTRPC